MKTFTHEYSSKKNLQEFIKNNFINNYIGDLLIQVFTSVNDKNYITYLRDEILELLPKAKIIGTTTNGEISNNGSIENSTVLSISVFEKTQIYTSFVENTKDSFHQGKEIVNKLNNNKSLKLLITFTDGLNTNADEYLKGISSVNDQIAIAGGMASDYSRFHNTFVFNEKSITNNGSVAAGFYGDFLNIHTDYSFNWETVGKTHKVGKAIKNRVYEIAGMSTVDFYKYYLGEDVERLLPTIGIEFPLILKKNKESIARLVIAKHTDKSLSFTGNIEEGSTIQFGHGDVQNIIEKGIDNIKNILQFPVESIFIYSCAARKVLLEKEVNLEILPLKNVAPISGFFANGEFYRKSNTKNAKAKLLNHSMSLLAISENERKIERLNPNIFNEAKIHSENLDLHRTQAFSTLIRRTSIELKNLNENLHNKVQEEIELNQEKDNMLTLMHTQAQLGSTLEMIIHQWRQPISAITSTLSSLQVYKEAGILTDDIIDQNIQNVMEYTEHINTTIEDFRELFKATNNKNDIKIDQLIHKSLTIIKPILLENRINIDLNLKSTNIVTIPVGLMMQVILNIVKNAIDMLNENHPTNPVITINVFENEQYNIIEIEDNAGGIKKENLTKIFQKNFTTKNTFEGTGIGLHMSKKIIETKINGSLTAQNRDNKALFTISIPK